MDERIVQADQRTLLALLGVVNLGGVVIGLSGLVSPWGWSSAALAVGLGLAAYLGYLVVARCPRWSTNVFLLCLCAGIVELWADHWLVHGTGTLIYADGGPFVIASPLYMPLAWAGMLATHLAIARAVSRRTSMWTSTLLTAAISGSYLPLFEYLAFVSDWWHYEGTSMWLGVVPVFIAVGELAIGLPLALVATRLERASPGDAIMLGAGLGLWIFACYTWTFAWCT